jgi:two-component system, NtrC family, sensor kinase
MNITKLLQRPFTLRLALLAGVLVPVVLVVALAGSWSLRLLEQQVNQRMQEDIELIAHAIRLPLSHAMERDRSGSINQALNSAFNIDVVYGAYVYDANGEEIARSGRRAARVENELAATLAASGDQLGEFSQAGDEEIFSYFVPLTDTGGRITGLLQLTRRGSDFSDYIAMVRQTAWLALGALCLLLVVLVIAGHHFALGRPVRRMLDGMARIRDSSNHARLSADGPQEIRELSQGINNMLDRIDRSEKLATIGRLAAGVAHELGSPLATLDGKAQQALRDTPADSRTSRLLRQIREQSQRMTVIIRQLLDYGRDNPLHRAKLDLESLLEQASERALSELNPESRKDVTLDIDGPSLRIDVDPLRFDQALTNLIANALHACRKRVAISWASTTHQGDSGTQIIIEDDGQGVDPKEQAHLFDPFYTTKPVGQGTGLGLAVARAAIADHGGTLELASSSAEGTCFVIFLPEERPA